MDSAAQLRIQLNLSQQQMAELLGISRSHYSMYECGRRNLGIDSMQMLAVFLQNAQSGASEGASLKRQLLPGLFRLNDLKLMLCENSYKTTVASRKLKACQKKEQAEAARLLLMQLKLNPDFETICKKRKTKNPVSGQRQTALMLQLEIKLEVLAFEKRLLEKRISAAVKCR